MGADFIISYLSASPDREIDFVAGGRAIEELAHRPLAEWPAEFLDYAGVQEAGKDMSETRAELVQQLMEDLVVLEAAVAGRRRDVWVGEIGAKKVALTGGMTWGEPPTEAGEAFDRLWLAGITRAMWFD